MNFITGAYNKNIGEKVWKNIRLSINDYEQQVAKDLLVRARYQLKNWENRVWDVLSDYLPKEDRHSLRDPSRLFPHLNSGRMRDSIDSGVRLRSTAAGNYSVTSWAEIKVPYASFTNQGFRQRADGIKPKWVGWMDDVFKGTRGFYSVNDIFRLITLEREAIK